jgi:hypothetical protein
MADYRFGKHPPKVDYRTLRFKDYLKPGIAAPPASYNVLDTVYQNLKIKDLASTWDFKCKKIAFRSLTIVSRGRPARCSMKVKRSMRWATTGTA